MIIIIVKPDLQLPCSHHGFHWAPQYSVPVAVLTRIKVIILMNSNDISKKV